MSGIDYQELQNGPSTSILRPLRAAAGIGMAVVSAAGFAWNHLHRADPLRMEGTSRSDKFVPTPKNGMEQVLLTSGPTGNLRMIPPGFITRPASIFVYPQMRLQGIKELEKGARSLPPTLEEAWVYGISLQKKAGGLIAVPTGEEEDVVKGRIMSWPATLFPEKLLLADQIMNYSSKTPNQGRVRRDVIWATFDTGVSAQTYLYYQPLPLTKNFKTPKRQSPTISLDKFALRAWDPTKEGHIEYDPAKFIKKVNQHYNTLKDSGMKEDEILKPGYAPFCKHLFMQNFIDMSVTSLPITRSNEHLLRTKYEARKERELPVLIRFFPRQEVVVPRAEMLDLILYSREQIGKENAAMGEVDNDTEPWALISVKPQREDYETPMEPITMMRNALGREEGGSGVPLDRQKYLASVEFWSKNAPVL
eukprot:gb/GEZN01008397.1/.p1 GENE.gb/GEZN01008397.1/~~gb/GEZN01008397.1/.p1  ORF type:complete len:420 (+),score=48.76 gb/GEZN01008397.1/:57-1316(+)